MNQILSTERQVNVNKKEKKQKSTNDSQFSINSIVKFFAIVLIVFGACLSANGVYAFYQSKNNTADIPKPNVHIEREDAQNINIIVSSTIGITSVDYSINGESKTVNGEEKTEVTIPVELTDSSNNIIITARDKKKQESTYQKTIESGPKITLEPQNEDSSIKVIVEASAKIDYIEYWWDDEEEQKEMVDETYVEKIIEVIEGEHTLNVKAVDINGVEETKSRDTLGVKAPEVEVTTNRVDFVIEASDEEEITKVEITFNGEELEPETVNEKTYKKNLKLKQGENRVIITVYNKDGVKTTKRVRYELK